MSRFLNILRFSGLLSGILSELVPELIREFRKRDTKELVVTKVTPVSVSRDESEFQAQTRH